MNSNHLLIKDPTTFWLTGLSGSGKSTFLPHLVKLVKKMSSKPCVFFDGDDLRSIINRSSYDMEARVEIGLTYSRLCKNLNNQGFNVVIACIALYPEIHNWNIRNINSLRYILLDVPIIELKRRDPKGIYKRSESKGNKNIAGIDIPITLPPNPTVHYQWKEGDKEITMINYCSDELLSIYT